MKKKQFTPCRFKHKENDVMQTPVHWEMLCLSQKVLPTALRQWMFNEILSLFKSKFVTNLCSEVQISFLLIIATDP